MQFRRGAASVLLVAVWGLWPSPSRSQPELELARVLAAVKREIYAAQQAQTGQPRITIDEVVLRLSVNTTTEAGGGVTITVPFLDVFEGKFAGTLTERSANNIMLVFKPPVKLDVSVGESLALSSAIQGVKKAIQATINIPPPLELVNFDYSTNFIVTRNAAGEVSFLLTGSALAESQTHNEVLVKMSRAR